MSEHQYYEFAALDHPLTAEEQEELRAISPRFEVDSRGLKCFHSLDELKVDPKELVARYFDAYFYASNWGGYTLMFRFPRGLVDLERLNLYENGDTLAVSMSGEFCLVRFRVSTIVDTYGELRMEKGEYLPALLPLRSDILRGDLRCLYLSWLQDMMALYGEMEFKEQPKRRVRVEEPPVPSGLNEPTPALQTFIDLFDISRDLVAAAAERSAPLYQAPFTNEPPRTVSELMDLAGRHGEERARMEAWLTKSEQERQLRETICIRQQYLDSLVGHEPELWQKVDALLASGQSKSYNIAVKILRDLRDLAQRGGQMKDFEEPMRALREHYKHSPALLSRIKAAKL